MAPYRAGLEPVAADDLTSARLETAPGIRMGTSVSRPTLRCLSALVVALAMGQAVAQKLPPPSRTVFKCDVAGKVFYSDSPCLGAQRVDVEPTRGLNKSSGAERIGKDVRQERQNEQIADALKPIFGETAQERAKRHARFKLSPEARSKCATLDREIPAAEQQELAATPTTLGATQARLLGLRGQYRELRC